MEIETHVTYSPLLLFHRAWLRLCLGIAWSVYVCVCLCVGHDRKPCKTATMIEMTHVGLRNH